MKVIDIKIYLAENFGFCGGVKRAVKMALENANSETYSYGDIVHNNTVIDELKKKGVKSIDNIFDIKNSTVITRSHGTIKEDIKVLEKNNNKIINCTCPKVTNIYNIVFKYYQLGYIIVIIGDKKHPEIIGINSFIDNSAIIIQDEENIGNIPNGKLLIVSQTTNNEKKFKNIVNIIKNISKDEVLVYNTICNATKVRQDSVEELAKKVDAILVFGGKKSSNTKKLAEVAKKNCKNVYLLETIKDIDYNILKKFNNIGITAGASTPLSVIKEAVSSMEKFDDNQMMEAIDNSFKRIRKGEIVEGEVLFVNNNEVMVNIGYRSDGIISASELSNDPNLKPEDLFKPGDKIQVYILKMDDGEGNVVLSYKRVESLKVWDEIEQLFKNNEDITVKVKSVVKGGLIVDLRGVNAFIPASQISIRFQRDLSKFVDKELTCKIIDFNKAKKRIVLSSKIIEEEKYNEKKKEVYDLLHVGDIVEGTVQRLTNFGAFVDLGGVDGLIHISELSWNRVKHPSDVVSPNQKVEVQVLDLDQEKNKIALGLKQTTKKPWNVFIDTIKVGDIVTGKVVNLLDFGAFVRLDSGVDGLLHVSQISNEHIEKPSDKLKMNDEVTVKVTDIDTENKKISFSIKALFENKEPKKEEKPKAKKIEKKARPVVKEFKREPEEDNDDDFNTSIGDLINFDLKNK